VIGSILHGAYGDLYEQAVCLKHYALTHPDVAIKLFFSRHSRLESFQAFDLSFALQCGYWTEIEHHRDIEHFLQFQIHDDELKAEVLDRLDSDTLAKFDRKTNLLPWLYLRDNGLLPTPREFAVPLAAGSEQAMTRICAESGIDASFWKSPTLAFLWRYRRSSYGSISNFCQQPAEKLVADYSRFFQRLIREYRCKLLVLGMNIRTTDENRDMTDNKYPDYGLNLPEGSVVYLKGSGWPIELEIASKATICCGNASGFTEALWMKRSGDVILMNPPIHYVAKAVYHRMPLFSLNHPLAAASQFPRISGFSYRNAIEKSIRRSS
jgi:hypothetical protein